jgi:hypothetical protein
MDGELQPSEYTLGESSVYLFRKGTVSTLCRGDILAFSLEQKGYTAQH